MITGLILRTIEQARAAQPAAAGDLAFGREKLAISALMSFRVK
jgi:hypothetical protein